MIYEELSEHLTRKIDTTFIRCHQFKRISIWWLGFSNEILTIFQTWDGIIEEKSKKIIAGQICWNDIALIKSKLYRKSKWQLEIKTENKHRSYLY